ncbi:EF-hand domain-containing protein [Roseovarius sp. SCSIO 43702]|uniref:EF-hand domain-containing protein n=1 Tax=Roseovarius sp. SCSIO 43702 TaxID=2823043 RepID=UPI001C73418B|nr:EF-hand domain-containing protein [Roseovarius sp. SCSIO 43702]QYX57450.1 EF-hand domain-containing protein [Roseovarius sp. SCSIO 43702]
MKRTFFTALTATTALVAAPALAAEEDLAQFCENAFYAADSNADGQFSEKEVNARRDAEFAAIDANKDGSIDREEFTNCMTQKRDKAAEQQASMSETDDAGAKWSDIASDGQQELTREDFAAWAEKAWSESDGDKETLFKQLSANLSDVIGEKEEQEGFAQAAVDRFKAADENGDGVLTQAEFETPLREKEYSDQGLDEQFQQMDADNSGAISPQEYRAAGTWSTSAMGTTADSSDSGTSEADDEATISVIRYYILTQ